MKTNENKITWISSYPKSGNTWVRSLITAYIRGGRLDLNKIIPLHDKMISYHENIVKQPIKQWNIIDQALIKPAVLVKMLKNHQTNIIIKTHDCNVDISGVAQIPRDITLSCVYIVRDPRDVALSIKHHYGFKSNAEAVNKILDENSISRFSEDDLFSPHLSWKINVKSWMANTSYPVYIVKYEDLLEKPLDIFTEIIKFLGFKYDLKIAKAAVDACTFDNMQQLERKYGFRESVGKQFFYAGKAQRWKTELEPELQAKIIDACKIEMRSLGYI